MGISHDDEDGIHHARVKRTSVDDDGKPMGIPSKNSLLGHRKHKVEFINGRIKILTANIIAENLLAQIDDYRHRHLLINEIEDHQIYESDIPKSQGTCTTPSVMIKKKRKTRGWEFYVRWKGGSGDWIAMKDLKDLYPAPLADYAMSNVIQDEPVFAWWIPFTLKKRNSILQKIKPMYHQRTHKYVIQIPKNVREAQDIDTVNGNKLWMESVQMEMKDTDLH